MDFSEGIPAEAKTLVLVPIRLIHADNVDDLCEALEVRFLANRDPHLHFCLLTDFRDASTESQPEDALLLQLAEQRINALSQMVCLWPMLSHLSRKLIHMETVCRWSGWLPIYSRKFNNISTCCSGGAYVAMYAFYYTGDGSNAQTGNRDQAYTGYKRHDISFYDKSFTYQRPMTRTDCKDFSKCTYKEEIQNFANWFSFYRTWELMTKRCWGQLFQDSVNTSALV